jgi:hypothetical protein
MIPWYTWTLINAQTESLMVRVLSMASTAAKMPMSIISHSWLIQFLHLHNLHIFIIHVPTSFWGTELNIRHSSTLQMITEEQQYILKERNNTKLATAEIYV